VVETLIVLGIGVIGVVLSILCRGTDDDLGRYQGVLGMVLHKLGIQKGLELTLDKHINLWYN
jgi:hypothetical protein